MNSRFVKIALAGAPIVGALVVGSSVAFGGLHGVVSSGRGRNAGVVVVNTSLAVGGGAAGTGIVLTSSGEVLTNNHVIRGATAIRVTDVSAGRTYAATVAGYSVSKDVALLKLRDARGLETALIGNSATIKLGDRVTAIGNAGGTGALSTKSGKLTGLRQAITVSDDEGSSSRLAGLIETSAPLRPGDSGGPLLSHGRVIGIDAAASSDFKFQAGGGEGFAIPINSALGVAKEIEAGHRSSTVHVGPTAFLGVALGQSGSNGQDMPGAIVQDVVPGSPADKAGVGPDDLITAFGGHQVMSPTSLRTLVLRVLPGRTMRLAWINQYTGKNSATVRLVSGPPQ
jgi:S1-C subfamily serine protease